MAMVQLLQKADGQIAVDDAVGAGLLYAANDRRLRCEA